MIPVWFNNLLILSQPKLNQVCSWQFLQCFVFHLRASSCSCIPQLSPFLHFLAQFLWHMVKIYHTSLLSLPVLLSSLTCRSESRGCGFRWTTEMSWPHLKTPWTVQSVAAWVVFQVWCESKLWEENCCYDSILVWLNTVCTLVLVLSSLLTVF